ncbi:hypothetical protein vseg_000913 [Gypsophila vaccaria]
MPSGAKKRKAAKKKLEKEGPNFTINNGSHSHSQGSDDPQCHDERNSGGGVEGDDVKNHDEGVKEVGFEGGSVGEDGFDDVIDHANDAAGEFQNCTDKSSSSSSSSTSSRSSRSGSSSSLGDVEVVLEKETPARTESGEVEPQEEIFATPCAEVEIPAEFVKESIEIPFQESVEETISTEEMVKQVVSLPQETVPFGDSSTSDVIESGVKPLDEKTEAASGVVHLLQAETEEKVIPVVDGGSENTTEPVGVTVGEDEVLLPQSSGVKAAEGCCLGDDGKVTETHKYTEDEPLLSSAPMPVRRTSFMNCCGLFEVFAGGSSR